MANRVTQGEIFAEGEDGDDGGGDGDGPGGSEEDDGDNGWNENERGEDALPSHRNEILVDVGNGGSIAVGIIAGMTGNKERIRAGKLPALPRRISVRLGVQSLG